MRTPLTLWILCWLASIANQPGHAQTPVATSTSSAVAKPLFRDFIGINGHTVNFKPDLYAPVCRLVRDYHPMDWDTGADSDYKLDFPFARNRVSWEHVYGSWRAAGFKTSACVMFETLPADSWKDMPRDAHRYGQSFAKAFGPSSPLAVVESVEIGNEPGKYSDESYRLVFENMATGLREADPKLRIATCNVNVGDSGDYHKSVKCVEGLEALYDVLNVHTYAMLEQWPTWKRSYPEDPMLPAFVRDVDELIEWRNTLAPGKEIWVTEFGWDSSTKTPASDGDFAKWQGNSDVEQAQWLVRSFFLFATRDVARAYIYFFNDSDEPKLHAASGLTRDYQPKPSYHAVSHLYRTLGHYRFSRIVHEVVGQACVYEFSHEFDAQQFIWVAWSPTGAGKTAKIELPFANWSLLRAERMPLGQAPAEPVALQSQAGKLAIEVQETPTYLFLRRNE
ncbi:MAG: hypothetical protein ACO1RT_20040 [Planctomycetaceae bacterium]